MPQNIWIPFEKYRSIEKYVYGAYQRLETDFIKYLDYIPLREEYLSISSQRLANFILRIFPLLSKVFKLVTFGEPMKNYTRRSIRFVFGDTREREETFKELNKIYEKMEKNEDYLICYYKLHDKPLLNDFWGGKPISMQEVKVQERIGLLNLPQPISPFEHKNWYSWQECRNAIDHRDKTEVSLKEVLYGIACLEIILEKCRMVIKESLDSDLFIVTKIIWV